jgi:ATP-dependent DNA helicase DinG
MARAVGAALARLEPLIVEAGTGTGKTFAYLVPALAVGAQRDHLHGNAHPAGPAVSPRRADARAGARHAGEIRAAQGPRQLPVPASPRTRDPAGLAAARRARPGALLARVSRWASSTKTGDLAELTDMPEQSSIWPSITSTRENCLGQECPQFSRCHVLEARRAAQAADIVVVNHHLLLADLALKDEGFGDLLPGAEAVILDEAHQVPDIAAQFFGQLWSVRQAQILLRDCRRARRASRACARRR